MTEEKTLLRKTDLAVCINQRLKTYSRMVDKIYRNHLSQFEVTSSQLTIMFVVGKIEYIPQSEVGKILLLERSTISRDLTRLVKRGLVKKSGDALRPMLALTTKGKHLVNKVIPAWKTAHKEACDLLGSDFVGLMPPLNKLKP